MFYALTLFIGVVIFFKISEGDFDKRKGVIIISTIVLANLLVLRYDLVYNIHYQMNHNDIRHFSFTDLEDNRYLVSKVKMSSDEDTTVYSESEMTKEFSDILASVKLDRMTKDNIAYSNGRFRDHIGLLIHYENRTFYGGYLFPNMSKSNEVESYDIMFYDNNSYPISDFFCDYFSYCTNSPMEYMYTVSKEDSKIVSDYLVNIIEKQIKVS